MTHPNAFVASLTTGIAWLVYRISAHYDWLELSPATALLVAGGVVTAVLFVGRRGVKATVLSVWRGSEPELFVPVPVEPPK